MPVRVAVIKKTGNNKCWQEWVEKGTLVPCCLEYKLQPLWKTIWRFLKKLKIELSDDPAIALLDIYPEKIKTLILKDICTPIICSIQNIDAIELCIDKWVDKEDAVSWNVNHKKNEILSFVTTCVDPEGIMEKEMATHSSVLAWRIPGTGEPGGLSSLGSHRVGHDWSDLAAAAAAAEGIMLREISQRE